MKRAICKLRSLTPVTFGRPFQFEFPKEEKERDDLYDLRIWKERAHFTKEGFVKIPGIMISNCIKDCAQFSSIQIPGKGKSLYTKHFKAGIYISDDIVTKVKKEDLMGVSQFVPSNGRTGGTTRVVRKFPIIHEWEGEIEVFIGDDVIIANVFETVIREAGKLRGIGTWRPASGGNNGRFELISMKWIE